MKGFLAFTKKELIEQSRTYKWIIIVCTYFLFGMTSPLLAKLMPKIFASMKLEGMQIIIPTPTVMDAYAQYFKNMTQMGILILLLVFGGVLSSELSKGTLINILAKGLPRPIIILSKYVAAVILWTVGYLLSVITDYGYTVYLFKDSKVQNLIFSLFCLWLFGCFVLSLIILSSTLMGGNFGGLILSSIILGMLLFIGIFPKLEKYNPITLASQNTALLSGAQSVDKLLLTVWVTIILIMIGLGASITLFEKKKI